MTRFFCATLERTTQEDSFRSEEPPRIFHYDRPMLWNRAGHYIFAVISIFPSSFSSPNLSGRRLDVYHTSTQCGLSANLECMSEMCCTRPTENIGRKNRHFGTITQLCQAVSSQLRHVSYRQSEKNS